MTDLTKLFGILLAITACGPSEAPKNRQTAPLAPDLATVDSEQRQQIELLRAALEDNAGSETSTLADRHGELGNAYHIAELLDAAAEVYDTARRHAPDDIRWPYYLGMVLDARGDLEQAAASFERVLERSPDHVAALLRLADLQLRLNRLPAARESFTMVLDAEAASAAAHHGLARLASIDGHPETAAQHLEKALELQPEADSLHYPLAQAYRKLGDEGRARLHLDQRGDRVVRFADPLADRLSHTKTLTAFDLVAAKAADPDGLSDEDFLGFVIEQVGEVEAAPEQLARMLDRGPANPLQNGDSLWRARLHYALGGLLARTGSDTEAAQHFEQAVQVHPDLRDARLRLANALARLKRFDQAGVQYSILLESEPDDGEVLLKRATAWLNLGRFEAAGIDLRRLVEIYPGNGMAHLRLAAVLRRAGQPADAIHHLELALATDLPADGRLLAHRTAAGLLQAAHRDQEALVHFEAAASLAPDDTDLTRELARLLASSTDDAVRDGERSLAFAEALFRAEQNLSNAETMAMALAAAGRFSEAAEWQRKLIAEAQKLGHDDHLPRLREAQASYERQRIARSSDS